MLNQVLPSRAVIELTKTRLTNVVLENVQFIESLYDIVRAELQNDY